MGQSPDRESTPSVDTGKKAVLLFSLLLLVAVTIPLDMHRIFSAKTSFEPRPLSGLVRESFYRRDMALAHAAIVPIRDSRISYARLIYGQKLLDAK